MANVLYQMHLNNLDSSSKSLLEEMLLCNAVILILIITLFLCQDVDPEETTSIKYVSGSVEVRPKNLFYGKNL